MARKQAFLDAARQVFLANGYEQASVNDIVRKAGGSLATLYAQFGNKEGLFLATLKEQHELLLAAMTPARIDHLNLEDGLQAIGEQFLRAVLSRDNLTFLRLVIAEGRKFPDSALKYMTSGGERVRSVVRNHLAKHAPALDADATASFFIEALRSRHHYHALVDDGYVLSDGALIEHVGRVVGFFSRCARPA
ncbi:MAG: TetR/AcrR family transcriptional regulator [Hyphomonadaceae bacterium]|nr:TetR/AcrR family transcriptional regulator [Hyphomonadaceae bacterium]